MAAESSAGSGEETLANLVARQNITDLCHAYCRALDRVDEELLRSVFHPDSVHRHGDYVGTSEEFCGFAITAVRALHHTHHQLGNLRIELRGDQAYGESYFTAYHRAVKGQEGFGGLFDKHDIAKDEDVLIGGRYIDRYERRDGVWKIVSRTGVHDWEKWSTPDERELPLLTAKGRGQRDRSDPSYARD